MACSFLPSSRNWALYGSLNGQCLAEGKVYIIHIVINLVNICRCRWQCRCLSTRLCRCTLSRFEMHTSPIPRCGPRFRVPIPSSHSQFPFPSGLLCSGGLMTQRTPHIFQKILLHLRLPLPSHFKISRFPPRRVLLTLRLTT